METRKHIRFPADAGDFALLDSGDVKGKPGLILNESQSGCALVFCGADFISAEGTCLIKVGKLDAIEAEVVWSKKIDDDICKIGFKFKKVAKKLIKK